MSELQVSSEHSKFGVYLSPDGLATAMRIHHDYTTHNMNFDDDAVARLQSFLENDEWSDFDRIYLFLYRISLLNGSTIRRLNPGSRNSDYIVDRSNALLERKQDHSQMVKVDFLLDIKLQRIRNRYELLDEFAVHTLMAFTTAFMRHMNFPSTMSYIDTGCVALSFCVEVPHASHLAHPFGIADRSEVGSTLVQRRLSMPHWETLQRRFHVQDQHIQTLNKT